MKTRKKIFNLLVIKNDTIKKIYTGTLPACLKYQDKIVTRRAAEIYLIRDPWGTKNEIAFFKEIKKSEIMKKALL